MHFEAFIDGACAGNGTYDAQGGYGIVLLLDDDIVMTASMPLCHCNGKRHTSNMAELRAALFMMKFIHEFGAVGKPVHTCKIEAAGADGRSMDGEDISLTVQSDSTFVVDGYNGKNKHKAHKDVWEQVGSSGTSSGIDIWGWMWRDHFLNFFSCGYDCVVSCR